jgi:hypothetical protein
VLKAHVGKRLVHCQQDDAPIHTSKYTLSKLVDLGLDVIKWPARSPDLNIMENVWGMIADIVYDGPQYDDLETLWEAILDAVQVINRDKKAQILEPYFLS